MKKNSENKATNIQNKTKKPTKEKIFDSAVDLFSKKGYNDVSIREIAKEAGIREGSIYNHYKNKETLLDAIIEYFKTEFNKSNKPEEEFTDFMSQGPEVIFEEGVRLYMERINTRKMEKIWRLICIETYHNDKIREFFNEELLKKPLAGWEELFKTLIGKNMIKPVNPRILAYEYWSFAIFLFFDCYILKYDDDFDFCMKEGLEKMTNHTKFLLESIKLRTN